MTTRRPDSEPDQALRDLFQRIQGPEWPQTETRTPARPRTRRGGGAVGVAMVLAALVGLTGVLLSSGQSVRRGPEPATSPDGTAPTGPIGRGAAALPGPPLEDGPLRRRLERMLPLAGVPRVLGRIADRTFLVAPARDGRTCVIRLVARPAVVDASFALCTSSFPARPKAILDLSTYRRTPTGPRVELVEGVVTTGVASVRVTGLREAPVHGHLFRVPAPIRSRSSVLRVTALDADGRPIDSTTVAEPDLVPPRDPAAPPMTDEELRVVGGSPWTPQRAELLRAYRALAARRPYRLPGATRARLLTYDDIGSLRRAIPRTDQASAFLSWLDPVASVEVGGHPVDVPDPHGVDPVAELSRTR